MTADRKPISPVTRPRPAAGVQKSTFGRAGLLIRTDPSACYFAGPTSYPKPAQAAVLGRLRCRQRESAAAMKQIAAAALQIAWLPVTDPSAWNKTPATLVTTTACQLTRGRSVVSDTPDLRGVGAYEQPGPRGCGSVAVLGGDASHPQFAS